MNRNYIEYGDDGVITIQGQHDVSWFEVRSERNNALTTSDLWMLSDRYDALTTEQQTELTDYRTLLRTLPNDYSTANDAADNFPTPPDWME
jgi:hypothetical protein